MSDAPAHLVPFYPNDRSLKWMPAIQGVRAFESAADEPRIWLSVNDEQGIAHLTLDEARKLADQLDWLIRHHYQIPSNRPDPPHEAPEGWTWTVEVQGDPGTMGSIGGRFWELADNPSGKQCRFSDHGKRCEKPGVVRLNRGWGDKPRWWWYCADHLYGRWIEDGKVVGWELKPLEAADA